MFERMLSFLRDLTADDATSRQDDPRIAVAALMYHVMDADGLRQDSEWEKVKELLAELYGIDGDEVDELVHAGQVADNEAVDLYAFTSVVKRSLDETARVRFVRLLWDVVYADNELHELEDNTLWRVAELIGVGSRDRIAMRQEAARNRPSARGASGNE